MRALLWLPKAAIAEIDVSDQQLFEVMAPASAGRFLSPDLAEMVETWLPRAVFEAQPDCQQSIWRRAA